MLSPACLLGHPAKWEERSQIFLQQIAFNLYSLWPRRRTSTFLSGWMSTHTAPFNIPVFPPQLRSLPFTGTWRSTLSKCWAHSGLCMCHYILPPLREKLLPSGPCSLGFSSIRSSSGLYTHLSSNGNALPLPITCLSEQPLSSTYVPSMVQWAGSTKINKTSTFGEAYGLMEKTNPDRSFQL